MKMKVFQKNIVTFLVCSLTSHQNVMSTQKMAEWLNDIFRGTVQSDQQPSNEAKKRHSLDSIKDIYEANFKNKDEMNTFLNGYQNVYKPPLARTRHIIPEFKPPKVPNGEWNVDNAKVLNMYFLTTFVKGYKKGWVRFENSKGGINPAAEDCICNVNILTTLRGMFLLSIVTGVRDLHPENIGMCRQCFLQNENRNVSEMMNKLED